MSYEDQMRDVLREFLLGQAKIAEYQTMQAPGLVLEFTTSELRDLLERERRDSSRDPGRVRLLSTMIRGLVKGRTYRLPLFEFERIFQRTDEAEPPRARATTLRLAPPALSLPAPQTKSRKR